MGKRVEKLERDRERKQISFIVRHPTLYQASSNTAGNPFPSVTHSFIPQNFKQTNRYMNCTGRKPNFFQLFVKHL